MSHLYLGSDLHIGHKGIHNFRCMKYGFYRDFQDEAEHRAWLFAWWNENIKKRDTVYLLGDICFYEQDLIDVGTLPGRKVLVKGNHDVLKSIHYPKVFDQVHGLLRFKHAWFSHAPIHPVELRDKPNVHGHVHQHTLGDTRYQNVCVEELMKIFGTPLVRWETLIEYRSTLPSQFEECEYD